MSGPSVIGALRVVLGLDSAAFEGGLTAAQAHMRKVGRDFEKIGAQMQSIGTSLSVGLTVPLLAFGAAALKASSDFEASMIKVGISSKATAEEMAQLETVARQIGKATIFSAGEAADAMDMLAKTGLSVAEILGGAAKATVDLAAAAGSELEPAASAISDSMKQFKLSAEDLPGVVNQITGAVNESKLNFDDFTLAIGQAGGVAANLGVSFEDFNAVLAGTSALFASGSDAGTSFKTFLTRMVPSGKQAAEAMAQYGLSFHDANGGMKSMSDIAEMLRTKLGGLSDASKAEVLTKIFGTDAMRTAIGLMEQGAAGIDSLKTKIGETDASAQAAERMKGFAGQMQQLKGSLEELGIAIGKSGLLEFATQMVTGLSGLIDQVSAANPAFLKFATVAGAVAAAVGPLVLAIGAAISAVGTIMGLLAAPVAVPIIGTVAAVGAAFAIFGSTIVPALQDFGRRVAEILGPKMAPLFEALKGLVETLGATFAQLFGPDTKLGQDMRAFGEVIARVWGASVDVITAAINVITNVVKALGALLSGDFAGAWTYVGTAMWEALKGLGNAFATIFPELVGWARKTYEGIREWLGTLLPKIFDAVKSKIREVGDVFYELYDRVVGHSYIPDMVEGVAAWMAKLDAGMVKPAQAATKKTAETFKELKSAVAGLMEKLLTDDERALRDYRNQVLKLRDGFEAGQMSANQLADALDRLHASYTKISPTKVPLPGAGETIGRPGADADGEWEKGVKERERVQTESLERMGSAFKGMFQELVATGKVNWERLLFDMLDNWQGVMGALKKAGSFIGSLFSGGGSGGGGIAGAIGGLFKGGGLSGVLEKIATAANGGAMGPLPSIIKTLGGGLSSALGGVGKVLGGIGSSITGALGGVGSALSGALGGIGSAISGALGPLMGAIGPLMGALGPVGVIAGIGAMLLKPKPSNQAALATFDGSGSYSVSGNKRTSETESAAKAAADAVKAGQEALTALGLSLGTTVRQIDIGTRDLTHVFLSSGQELRTAVGDPAAAAEAALKAVLQGATYTDAAQKALVDSMLAAGKGFDEVATGLQQFAQAQLLPKSIADQILKLTDPRAFDTKALVAEQQARRAEIEAQMRAGMLTAEQFAAISVQLTRLEGLELGDLGSRYAGQLEQTTKSNAAIEKARQALQAAYQKSSSELQSQISKYKSIGDGLGGFGDRLRGDLAGADPEAQAGTLAAEFRRFGALAQLGDTEAMAQLEKLGDAWIKASLGTATDQLSHLKVIGEVLGVVEGARGVADRHASIAEQQLAAMTAEVEAQLGVKEAILSLPEALAALLGAKAAAETGGGRKWGANPEVNAALAAATGYLGDFGAGGWQAWILEQSEQMKAVARQILNAFGQPERIVGFATGGSFQVGGTGGIDSQLVKFRASPDERVTITRPGQVLGDSDVANAVRGLEAKLMPAILAMASGQARLESRVERFERDGVWARGESVDDPVSVRSVA